MRSDTMQEPCVIMDVFVQGVGRIEEVSANLFRVSYFAYQRCNYEGTQEKICVAKFIITQEALLSVAQEMAGRQARARVLGETHSPMN